MQAMVTVRWDAEQQEWVRQLAAGDAGTRAGRPPAPVGVLPLLRMVWAEDWRVDGWPAMDPAGRGRRRRIAGAAAAVVLCAGLASGVWALVGGDDAPRRGAHAKPSATAGTGAGADAGAGGGSTADPTAEASASPTDSPLALPDGFRLAQEDGFTLAVPQEWERSVKNDQIFYTAPDGRSLIQISVVDNPTTSPYESLTDVEKEVARRTASQDYVRLGLEELPTGEGAAAELRYTYTNSDHGPRLVLDRAFEDGGRQYAVLVAVPADLTSSSADELQQNVLAGFCGDGSGCLSPED